MKADKLKTKEIITVVLMSLINILIFGFSSLLYFNPFTILLMPVYFALAQGVVYFMLGIKVPKKGVMLIYCIIQSVVTFNIPYILCYLVGGILAELMLSKMGYGSMKALTWSYVVIQVMNCVGSTIYPYALTLNATLSRLPAEGGSVNGEFIRQAGTMIQSWGSLVLIAVVILCALLGAFFGKKAAQKHLLKAGK